MSHFLGTLSFKENKTVGLSTETTYEIIDGQQRITTLFILIKVLINKLENNSVKLALQNAFIGTKDDLKLTPLGEDGTFLKDLLFGESEMERKKITKRSQRFLYDAFKEFSTYAAPLTQEEVEKKIIFIRDRMEVLVFNVESQAQAVKMFSIINDRGLPLRILDKTKSILMLYSTMHLNEKLNEEINAFFEKIFDAYDELLILKERLGILGRLEETTVFTQHYYSARHLFLSTWSNRDGAETIFNNLKLKCEELKDQKENLEEFIVNYISDFKKFACGYSSLLNQVESIRSYQKPFRFLEFSATLFPLLVRLSIQNVMEQVLDLLEAIEVRVYKLRGTNPIADVFLLSSFVAEKNRPVSEIRYHLLNFCEKFVSDHILKTYLEGELYRNGALKYILHEYNGYDFELSTYKNLQIEHIFSSEPNFELDSYDFGEDFSFEKNRIGNLALLETGLNIGLGNLPPINKVQGYLQSQVSDTARLGGEILKGPFKKNEVDLRRDRIVEYALSRFKLPEK